MEYLLIAIILIGLAMVVFLAWLVFQRGGIKGNDNAQAIALLQNQVNASAMETARKFEGLQQWLQNDINRLNEAVERRLMETGNGMNERLDSAAKLISDVRQQLGRLDEASRRIFDVGKDIAALQQALQAPKLRGSVGEQLLHDLLGQVLPQKNFDVQYRFKNGETADAVIRLSAGIIPIDAKFPLENFRRAATMVGDENAALSARRAFARDVRKHIDDIAAKYIRTDEGTFDFAMMYIPSESVFYEIVVREGWSQQGESLLQYALGRRVIPVSPNSFYAYLQTVLLGLRGMRIEENAKEIMNGILRLEKEMELFAGDFELVGTHLNNSLKKYAEAARRFDHFVLKVEQLTGLSRTAAEGVYPKPL